MDTYDTRKMAVAALLGLIPAALTLVLAGIWVRSLFAILASAGMWALFFSVCLALSDSKPNLPVNIEGTAKGGTGLE